MSVMIAEATPGSNQRKAYQQNLGNQIRRINESDSPGIANVGTPSDQYGENQENDSHLTNHF